MEMIKYTVRVFASGNKCWYLDDVKYTEADYLKKMNPKPTCEGKVIKVDGIKYKLMKE